MRVLTVHLSFISTTLSTHYSQLKPLSHHSLTITHHRLRGSVLTATGFVKIDIQAMLVWSTLPFYDFCGFRSVAVNSVYKLQFFYIYTIVLTRTDVEQIHWVRAKWYLKAKSPAMVNQRRIMDCELGNTSSSTAEAAAAAEATVAVVLSLTINNDKHTTIRTVDWLIFENEL